MRRFYNTIKRWLSYYFIVKNTNDYDWDSVLKVEKHQLERLKQGILKYKNYSDWKNCVNQLNLALALIDIIQQGNDLELATNRVWILHNYVNSRNANRFLPNFDNSTSVFYLDLLRMEKAWHLYHKLRLYYMRTWWN